MTDPEDPLRATRVFHHLTDPRTYPSFAPPLIIEELEIFEKNFQNVILYDHSSPESIVKFNYEVGIVSFTDLNGKTWRFGE